MIHGEKKGSHWVPLLIMAVLALCYTVLFYAFPMREAEPPVRLTSMETPWFSLERGILYFDGSIYTGGSQLSIPTAIEGAEVTAISDGCFRDCGDLTAIFLPETLNAIGEEAFRNCTALRGIQIPESVAFIGSNAFSSCSALEAIRFSNKMKHIAVDAFDGCSSLRYVYFLGSFQEWTELYRGFIDPSVVISCEDGKFYQSGEGA